MCGRYAVTSAPELIARLFGVCEDVPNFPPHYNAASTQDLPVVRRHPVTGERHLGLLRWGLIPSWADDPKISYRTINARAETLAVTPSFRAAFRQRRCLGIASLRKPS